MGNAHKKSEILREPRRWSLFKALTMASALSSVIAVTIGLLGGRYLVEGYIRDIVRAQQSTIESFFKDSISQQILVGDGPEVLRKCHLLLKENYVRAVYVKDLAGEAACDLNED